MRLVPGFLQHRLFGKFRIGNENFPRPTVFYSSFGLSHLQLRLAPRLRQLCFYVNPQVEMNVFPSPHYFIALLGSPPLKP